MALRDRMTPAAIELAFETVARRSAAAGADGVTPAAWRQDRETRAAELSERLQSGTWRPGPLARHRIRKPGGGMRRLAVPTVDDRVVVELLRAVVDPRIERVLSSAAWAYRRGKSARHAVELVSRRVSEGLGWAAIADIRDFFDTVPLPALLDEVRHLVDADVHSLVASLLHAHATRPGVGLAQGCALSPSLANLALTRFDRAMEDAGLSFLRYSDNLCAVASTSAEAQRALGLFRTELSRRGFSVKAGSDKVIAASEGFPWLGFVVGARGFRASEGALESLRARLDQEPATPTATLRERIEPIIRGWAQYFNTPLPPGASLGVHDRVARELLHERLGQHPDAPEPDIEEEARGAWAEEPGESEPETDDHAPEDARGEVAALLDQAESLAARGDFEGAQAAWQEAMARTDTPATSEPSPDPAIDDDAVDAWLALFCAGASWFAVWEPTAAGQGEYVRVSRPPGPPDVREHLMGRQRLAVAPRLDDGACTLAVIDIDGPRDGRDPIDVAVAALGTALRQAGVRFLVEDTGGRGAHVWIPLEGRVCAADVARLVAEWCRRAGDAGGAVTLEALPAGDEATDAHDRVMALPLGVHRGTGRRSHLTWDDGTSVSPTLEGIFCGGPSALPLPVASPRPTGESVFVPAALPAMDSFGAGVARVMSGCQLLSGLARRSAMVGHLTHHERTSLLHSLGHLGTHGERAIHAIIGKCRNYDVAETQRHIGRLTAVPIGCRRLQDKHPELAPDCRCDFSERLRRGGFPTPLLHAGGFLRAWRDSPGRPAPRPGPEATPAATSSAAPASQAVPAAIIARLEEVPAGMRAAQAGAGPATGSAGVLVAPVTNHEWA